MKHLLELQDITSAARMYYEKLELNTSDIQALFGCCKSKAEQLKKAAKEKVIEEEAERKAVLRIDRRNVPTKIAFSAWGIDIHELEDRIEKLAKLNKLIGRT